MSTADDLQALAERSRIAQVEHRYEEAAAGYWAILAQQPDNPAITPLLVMCLNAMHRYEEAWPVVRAFLASEPSNPFAHTEAAVILSSFGEHERALHHFERAVEAAPTLREAVWNLALTRIAHGDRNPDMWQQGWETYRIYQGGGQRSLYHNSPEWDGEWLGPRKTLYIKWEQGCGDTIMFARYVLWAKKHSGGARIIFEVQEPLVSLLLDMPVEEVIAPQNGHVFAARFDAHVSLISLAGLANRAPDELAEGYDLGIARVGFARSERARPKIGLCNQGNPTYSNDFNRSIPWAEFREITRNVNADFQYLAPGPLPGSLAPRTPGGRSRVPRRFETLPPGKFADTARIMADLDLVVTVDTGVAHLAGMIGVPVWNLLPCNPDFRWFHYRQDTPWYPSMRLVRQSRYREWGSVIETVNWYLRQ